MMWIKRFLAKRASLVTALVMVVATSSANFCRCMWYQPKEPDGLDEFVKRERHGKIFILEKMG